MMSAAVESVARHAWVRATAQALGCEYGQNGHGGHGWTVGASDHTPPLINSWDQYWSGRSRLIDGKLSPTPDYILVNEGTNDDSRVDRAVAWWISKVRSAVEPTTPIYIVIPFSSFHREDILNGISQAADAHVFAVDLGAEAVYGLDAHGPSWRSWDGLHPDAWSSLILGSQIAYRIQQQLSPRLIYK